MSVIQARPTLYKGIQMRSRLEADYAAHLDAGGYRWEYEPECFASDEGQWLPDFGCTLASDGPLAIFDEVKPAEPLMNLDPGSDAFTEHVDSLLRRMAITWASRPGAALQLVFWRYGGPAYLRLFSVKRGAPWMGFFDGQPMEMIWPGLRQYMKAKQVEPGFHDEIARRWLGLAGVMARHAWPGGLCGGVLVIYVDGEEWAAKARPVADRLIQGLGLVFGDGLVRKIDIQLCEVAS